MHIYLDILFLLLIWLHEILINKKFKKKFSIIKKKIKKH